MSSPYVPTRFVNGIESGSEGEILPVVTYDAGNATFVDSTTDLPISGTGGGLGIFVNVATLQASHPAASNIGSSAMVGGSAPYLEYVSNGIAWIQATFAVDSSGNIIANIIPRTDTLANLQALVPATGGDGELCSATDTKAIVQLFAAGNKTYSPMAAGVWTDSTNTLKVTSFIPTVLNINVGFPSNTNTIGNGGSLEFNAVSTSFASGTAGNLSFIAGDSSGASSGNAGLLRIRAGNVISSAGNAGPSYIYAGDASGSGNGGNAAFSSGFAGSGTPGFVAMYPGYNNTSTGVGYLATSFAPDNYHEPTTIAAGEWAISWSDGGVAASPKVGFLGTTAIVKPTVTGSRATGAALVSLLTALANLGLIINSSSA